MPESEEDEVAVRSEGCGGICRGESSSKTDRGPWDAFLWKRSCW